MTFHIGQKVVCVKGPRHAKSGHVYDVSIGSVYTIREMYVCPGEGTTGLLLEEIINPLHYIWDLELGYYADRFRPVREVKTDISVFTKMLIPIEDYIYED